MTEREITYEILETKATLEFNSQGWAKQINIIKWNSGEPKYDIRYWTPDHKKMSRGMTFTLDQMKILKAYLNTDHAFDGPTPPIPDTGAIIRAKKAAKAAEREARRAEKARLKEEEKARKKAEREAKKNVA